MGSSLLPAEPLASLVNLIEALYPDTRGDERMILVDLVQILMRDQCFDQDLADTWGVETEGFSVLVRAYGHGNHDLRDTQFDRMVDQVTTGAWGWQEIALVCTIARTLDGQGSGAPDAFVRWLVRVACPEEDYGSTLPLCQPMAQCRLLAHKALSRGGDPVLSGVIDVIALHAVFPFTEEQRRLCHAKIYHWALTWSWTRAIRAIRGLPSQSLLTELLPHLSLLLKG